MKTDIILQDGRHFAIIDAKYYGAKASGSLPSTPDVMKQIFYRDALAVTLERSNIAFDKIANIFVFPSYDSRGKYNSVAMSISGNDFGSLPWQTIDCVYISVEIVLSDYTEYVANIELPRSSSYLKNC